MNYALEITDKALGPKPPTTVVFPCRLAGMQYAAKHYAPKGEPLVWKIQTDDSYTSSTDLMSFRLSKTDREAPPCGKCQIKNAGNLLTISKEGVKCK